MENIQIRYFADIHECDVLNNPNAYMSANGGPYQWHMLNEKWAGAANDCES